MCALHIVLHTSYIPFYKIGIQSCFIKTCKRSLSAGAGSKLSKSSVYHIICDEYLQNKDWNNYCSTNFVISALFGTLYTVSCMECWHWNTETCYFRLLRTGRELPAMWTPHFKRTQLDNTWYTRLQPANHCWGINHIFRTIGQLCNTSRLERCSTLNRL